MSAASPSARLPSGPSPSRRTALGADRGVAMHRLVDDLYPLCRSITGDGVRETLRRLREVVPLALVEVPSGTRVFDWTVPPEWTIRDAYIKAPSGERVVDFRACNLHVVGYSRPIRAQMSLDALQPHLFTLPDRPDWIPYRTSYYADTWGFCLSQKQRDALRPGTYEVCIDATLEPGALTYGEVVLPGQTAQEILISTHVCHPSLCNDNLSGIVVAAALAQALGARPRRYSYRFVFVPGTIGSLTWLARNRAILPNIKGGLVLTCLGDRGTVTYKRSLDGDAEIDRAVAFALRSRGAAFSVRDFSPFGYDERQYNAPGFRLSMGCLMRTPHGEFAEYHTSADDPAFVTPESLHDSLTTCLDVVDVLEGNRTYVNRCPYGEPQLGRRGLYTAVGGETDRAAFQDALLWLLNLSDGSRSLLDIAERAGLSWALVRSAADALAAHGLLEPCTGPSQGNAADRSSREPDRPDAVLRGARVPPLARVGQSRDRA